MLARLLAELRTLRSGILTLYRDGSAAAGRMRYEHLSAVVRLTPYAMAANVGCASLVLWAFRGQWTAGMVAWWVALSAIAGLAMRNWLQFSHRTARTVSCRGIRRSTWHAAALAGTWAYVPLVWFADASAGQQLVIATLFTGMLGAGTFVLGALPLASLAYAGLFTVASLGALAQGFAREPMMLGVAVLLGFYASMVLAGSLASWRKATALLQSQGEAVRHEQMLAVMLQDFEQNAAEALWETDPRGRLRQPSARLAALLRTSAHRLQDGPLDAWLQQHCSSGADEVADALRKGLPFHGAMVTLESAGQTYHLVLNGKPLFDELGEPAGWRGVLADRSAVVSAQQELRRLAHTDSLTGLANRFSLHSTIAEQLRAQPAGGALLLIDLDHFKTVNDSLGHSVGDALLTAVAQRLQDNAPAQALVARLGGDEFAVLLCDVAAAPSEAEELAHTLVAVLARPYMVGERRLRVGASVGTASIDAEVTSVDELLVRADIALYDAKGKGRGRAAAYSPALRESTRRRTRIEDGLRQAVRNDELFLHWQARVDLRTWKVTGAEALMRWTHPELGPVSPGEFIPIAEHAGLIDLLGLWALRHACECGLRDLADVSVSVNVSAVQLADAQFVPLVQSVLASTGLPPGRLELEITESVFIEDADTALRQLHALRDLGVRIALDDFGTGYSSLSYLCRFPFDTLKIDRSFVQEAMVRTQALAIVHSIAQLAQSLGMQTVCEGIETPEQLAMVQAAGIHEAQGYLLSPPRPLAAFNTFVDRWDTVQAPLEYLP